MKNTFKIISNGSKWAGQEPDSIAKLLEVLEVETLNPLLEEYGNFLCYVDEVYESEEVNGRAVLKLTPCTPYWSISGNFLTTSHVFSIHFESENSPEFASLVEAIRKNQSSEAYKAAKEDMAA